MTQDKQEPNKDTILSEQQTQHFLIVMSQRDVNPLLIISEIAGAVMAHYEPLLATLQKRVKELEEANKSLDAHWYQAEQYNVQLLDSIKSLEAENARLREENNKLTNATVKLSNKVGSLQVGKNTHEHEDGTIHSHRQGAYQHIHKVGEEPLESQLKPVSVSNETIVLLTEIASLNQGIFTDTTIFALSDRAGVILKALASSKGEGK